MVKMKALKSHVYNGRNRRVGDVFDVGKSDSCLLTRFGWATVSEPEPAPVYSYDSYGGYETRVMQADPEAPRAKRKYTRRKVVEE